MLKVLVERWKEEEVEDMNQQPSTMVATANIFGGRCRHLHNAWRNVAMLEKNNDFLKQFVYGGLMYS